MTKTLVKDIVNPERTTVQPNSCFLPEGDSIYDLPLDAIPPEAEYICAINDAGECVGTVKAERIRKALRITAETSLTRLLDEVDEAIISVDAQGTIFYVNPSYRRMLNVAAGQLLGKDLHKVEPGSALLDALHEGKTMDIEKKRSVPWICMPRFTPFPCL